MKLKLIRKYVDTTISCKYNGSVQIYFFLLTIELFSIFNFYFFLSLRQQKLRYICQDAVWNSFSKTYYTFFLKKPKTFILLKFHKYAQLYSRIHQLPLRILCSQISILCSQISKRSLPACLSIFHHPSICPTPHPACKWAQGRLQY